MEARKETLSSFKLCRFCLAQGDTLTSIYEKRATKNNVNLPLKILSCVNIEAFPSDKMPTYICARCKFFMEMSYDFKHICRQADEHILQFVQNATPLTSMSWPQSLLKLFRLAHKTPEVPLMKTVIEGGTTVHVTAQESDTDEEDDENVYNVKIGDGSDDGSKSARVKVITDVKQEKGKQKRAKGFTTSPKLARHVRTHNEDRSFPCKYCNKSFVKSHHYTRHLRLKHRETIRTCRGPFGETDQYRCEQCEDSFATQDELIYHSAIHATQNLTCPLCQEKFEDVDAVTAHIKSHVNGTEFMCDLCELVFTSKEKLDNHINIAHDEELRSVPDLLQDESSTEMDVDEDEEDTGINVKELDDHMVVELKKADEYLLPNAADESEERQAVTNSEESDSEMALPDLGTAISIPEKIIEKPITEAVSIATIGGATITKTVTPAKINMEKGESPTASILRKAEEIKKKVVQHAAVEPIAEKKNNNKSENNSAGTSDKSLRMLEKELQELKRTNPRTEAAKTPAKPLETLRSRRAQIHTSTPKPRTPTEEKKTQVVAKSPAPEKKVPERRVVTKENKEPKDTKEVKTNNGNVKEEKDKETKEKIAKDKETKEKDVKQKEVKEKEAPKSVVKNGNDKSNSEEGIRRSTRPSKIKDYAKMIRDRSSIKTPAPKTTPTPRKRGRPRKDAVAAPVAAKVRKEEVEEEEDDASENEKDKSKTAPVAEKTPEAKSEPETPAATNESDKPAEQKPPNSTLVSPTGQTLKKIPIKALPPGVRPMPLPVNARPMGGGEVCEMQIGKKVVKVQKIVMTKAEVEAMAKKGLVEMKDGTMVLKQGIKLPTADGQSVLKTSLVGDDANKESPSKKEKVAPTRCDLGENL
uniref:C2H2-type domain-containing protein n=1 Tax=Heliothis virescens TaxID=7102 RepID=A0A2A4J6W9_HELVI